MKWDGQKTKYLHTPQLLRLIRLIEATNEVWMIFQTGHLSIQAIQCNPLQISKVCNSGLSTRNRQQEMTTIYLPRPLSAQQLSENCAHSGYQSDQVSCPAL